MGRVPALVRSARPFTVLTAVVAVLCMFLSLYPLWRILFGLFWSDGTLDLSPVQETLGNPRLPSILAHTGILVLATGILGMAVGAIFAWLNERTDARMGFVTDAFPLVPFLLPTVAGAIGWVMLLSPRSGILNYWIREFLALFGFSLTEGPLSVHSWGGLIFVMTLYQVPFSFLLISAGLKNIDPALEEQSRTSGAGLMRTLRRVTLPSLAPSLSAAMLLIVWTGMTMFSIPIIVGAPAGINVLAVEIVDALRGHPPETGIALGLSTITLALVGALWYAQRNMLRKGRHATLGGKGQRHTRIRLGKWRTPARFLFLTYVFLAAVLPILGLVLVALHGYWAPRMSFSNMSLASVRSAVFEDTTVLRSLRNSTTLAVTGAVLGILVASIVALYVSRQKGPWGRVVDGSIKIPLVISNIVMAVGILLAFAGPPFRLHGTWTILLLAYVIVYLPQGSVAADAAVSQVGLDLPDASRICGAGEGRTFRRIQLPLMVSGLMAGWALLFVRMVGDLTASAILAGPRNTVVGFQILAIWEHGGWGQLAALSFVLTVVTLGVLALALAVSRRIAPPSG